MVKKVEDLSHELPWGDISHPFFEEDTLIFTILHINPVMHEDESLVKLNHFFRLLQTKLDPWIKYFPWSGSTPSVEMANHKGYDYIHGQLVFGDSLNDEWLAVKLLYDLSSQDPDIYIHLFDTDGEFLLVESAETLPLWIEPSNSTYRDWINNGRVIIIPEEYYSDRGLTLKESLIFLERVVFKAAAVPSINAKISEKLNGFPEKCLQMIYPLEVELDNTVTRYLVKNPAMLVKCVNTFAKEKLPINKSLKNIHKTHNEKGKYDFPYLSYHLLKFYLEIELKVDFVQNFGKCITLGLDELISNSDSELRDYQDSMNDTSYIDFQTSSIDKLQNILIAKGDLKEFVKPDPDIEEPISQQTEEEDIIINKLKSFFEDTDAGLSGVTVGDDKPNTNFEDESDKDNDEEKINAELDNVAREYLKSENIDIDEDDFFEFFLSEALKLSKDDIDKYRSGANENEAETHKHATKGKEYNDDSDYNSDSSEEVEEEFGFNDEEDDEASCDEAMELEALSNLMKSMQTGSGLSGPASTLMQSLDISLASGLSKEKK